MMKMEGVVVTMTILAEKIEAIGRDIIQCTDGKRKMCTGARNDQTNGYYPRSFFLEPPDASKIEVAVVGLNPGKASELEKEFYKISAKRNGEEMASYDDCANAWRAVAKEAPYHKRTRHLFDVLGLEKEKDGILWAEVAFCEGKLTGDAFDHCVKKFLEREVSELLPENIYVLCLGKKAYHYVTSLPRRLKDCWKIFGVYHPTGSRGKASFSSYFAPRKDASLDSRALKPEIGKSFKKVKRGSPRFLGEE